MPRGRKARNDISDDVFFSELAKGGYLMASCAAAGYSSSSVYEWRHADPAFAERWEQALAVALERMEKEMDRRAVDGVARKKFLRNGNPIIDPATGLQYEEREYSDTLMMFRAKKLDPAYKDRSSVELTGANGGAIATTQNIDADAAAKIASLVQAALAREKG